MKTTWKDLVESEAPQADFVLDPYIPRSGITLLFGTTSIGKTPLVYSLCASISTGSPWFGLPTKQTPVLLIELDSTEHSTRRRLKKAKGPIPEDVHFCFLPCLNVPSPRPEHIEELQEILREVNPGLVIVNSLRKAHDLDDKDSRTVKLVYEWFVRFFAGRALMFIHHERKQNTNPDAVEDSRERFSGAMNWLNDAQVGLHLRKFDDGLKANLRLHHIKSQETELYKPMPLYLYEDGTNLKCSKFDELAAVRELMLEHQDLGASEMDKKISKFLNVSDRTARSRRSLIEKGLFPGPSYLGTLREKDEE